MTHRIHQYTIGKDHLYYFYRFVVLPWELEWSDQKFLLEAGALRDYCRDHGISIKSFDSTNKLNEAISSQYEEVRHTAAGMFWFVRHDTKPKDTLRHLRNCFAHGNYEKRQKNRVICISIENIDKGKRKAMGYLPVGGLRDIVNAALSCRV